MEFLKDILSIWPWLVVGAIIGIVGNFIGLTTFETLICYFIALNFINSMINSRNIEKIQERLDNHNIY